MTTETHGKHKSRVYRVWHNMKSRCQNPNHPHFHCYGGRGISVCPEWQDFEGFYADMGDPPLGKTLERIDNDEGYRQENCRWASRKAQAVNRRTTTILNYKGKGIPRPVLAKMLDVSVDAIRCRQRLGWSTEKIINTPFDGNKNRYIEFDGQRKTLSEWAKTTGIGRTTIAQRISLGWDMERVLSKDPSEYHKSAA